MKNTTKTLLLGIISAFPLIVGSNSSYAQASASASATANVVTPISIVKTTDLNFGNIAVSTSISGTAVLAPGGTRTTGGSGGVTLPSTSGTVSAASFTVSGQASYTYAITLPASCTLSDGSSHTMSVSNFTSAPATTGTLSTSGSQTLTVGATLNVSAAQAAGSYTNAAGIPVTVNYN